MSSKENEAFMGNWKALTVFYSHSGNTRECAHQIHQEVGGDIVELIPVDPYPTDYNTVVKQAKQELKAGYRPALRTRIENMAAYDVIFIGSPNWWNTVAPPVMTFLGTHDLSGKAVVPFITHEGSGLGRSALDIERLCSSSTVLEGLAIRGRDVQTAPPRVATWLRKLGM
jgi:flavodoxin